MSVAKKRKFSKYDFHVRLSHLKLLFDLKETVLVFSDSRMEDDLIKFFQTLEEWMQDDNCDYPSSLRVCLARLKYRQVFIQDTEEIENDDDDTASLDENGEDKNMYDLNKMQESLDIERTQRRRVIDIIKCIQTGHIHLSYSADTNGFETNSERDCLEFHHFEGISHEYASVEDMDVVASRIKAEFTNENSRQLMRTIWLFGIRKTDLCPFSVKELEALIASWDKKLEFRMNRERDVKWTLNLDFFFRWQPFWNFACWDRCVTLSRFLTISDAKYSGSLWTQTALKIIDLSMDEKERKYEMSSNSCEKLNKKRCNWPLIFMNILREFATEGTRRWKHCLVALSLFFNSMIGTLPEKVVREFVADVLNTFFISDNFFEMKISYHIGAVLKSLLVRSFFPSIYGGVLKTHDVSNSQEESFDSEEEEKRVEDMFCDPLFKSGQLCPVIDIGLGEMLN